MICNYENKNAGNADDANILVQGNYDDVIKVREYTAMVTLRF